MNGLIGIDGDRRKLLFIIIILSLLTTLPWLGLNGYYTKGEPREAMVSVAMLQQHNFILPVHSGDEIAYKPPFLHWCIAACSFIQGHVSEFTSRLPSAISAILMYICFFVFVSKRVKQEYAFLSTLILMSCFEIHRAAMTCRVDMLLTSLIVLSLLCIYKWYENHYKGLPVLIPLLISGAILTKGPIGVILPCFILFIFMLLKREKLIKICWVLIKITLSSIILPVCWYIAAYFQNPKEFLDLMIEENFGRFLGKMSYESHENNVIYNVYSLLAGLLPWILPVFFALFTVKISRLKISMKWWERLKQSVNEMDSFQLFAWVVSVCVFVFYSIPKSKRSVYLMPMYPFTCLLLAEYLIYLYKVKIRTWKIFTGLLIGISFLLIILIFSVRYLDLSILGTSKSSLKMIYQLSFIQELPLNVFSLFFIVSLFLITVYTINAVRKNHYLILSTIALFFTMQFALDALILPAIKSATPERVFAEEIKKRYPEEKIYSFKSDRGERFYTVNFYLYDPVVIMSDRYSLPYKGHVLVKEDELQSFEQLMGDRYLYQEVLKTENSFTDVRSAILLYEFQQK